MQVISGIGRENVVSDTGIVYGHRVSALPDGGYVTVWSAPNDVVKAQVFHANGTPESEVFDVGQTDAGEFHPDVTTLTDGSFVVTYLSVPADNSPATINTQRYLADGSPIGDGSTVNGHYVDTYSIPLIAALPDGGYAVVYQSYGLDGSSSFYGRFFDADGTPRGNDLLIQQPADRFPYISDVIALPDGKIAVTWAAEDVDGSSYGVMLRLYEPDGTPGTSEQQINQYWIGRQWEPEITVLKDGNALLTWTSFGQDGNAGGIYARLIGPDGSPLEDEFQVNTHSYHTQVRPDVTALSDGGFVVVWTRFTSVETATISGQRFSSDGERIGGEVTLSQEHQEALLRPRAVELSEGVIAVSWVASEFEAITGRLLGQITERQFLTPAQGSNGDDTLSGTKYGDWLEGLQGDDTLLGKAGTDTLRGGQGQDILKGNQGADRLIGGSQNDELFGGQGYDILNGGYQSDKLFGGRGNDILNGGRGSDKLSGGSGADTFLFRANIGKDTITDFEDNVDTLKLDEDLWGGGLSKQQLLQQYAHQDGDAVVLDFGWHEIRIEDYSNIQSLVDDIVFI